MLRLIKYVIVLAGISFLISYSLFVFLNIGLRSQKNDTFPVINELVNNNENIQVLFIGSSLAQNNINPIVFDSVTKSTSYNFGYPGAKIEHSQMIIKRYLNSNHPPPQKILIMLEPYVLDTTLEINFPVQYYPFYKDTIIYNFVSKYDPDIKFIKKFPFLGVTKYNDYLKYLGVSGVLFPNRLTSKLLKGFEPLDKNSWKENNELPKNRTKELLISKRKLDPEINRLEEICKLCSQKNIQLYFILPPTYKGKREKNYNPDNFINDLKLIVEKYNIHLFDNSDIDLCQKKELFFDYHHLNKKGADIYTRILANLIN